MHGEMGPVIVAIAKGIPRRLQFLLPSLVLGNEPPERREVDDDAIVEVRVPERRDAPHLLMAGPVGSGASSRLFSAAFKTASEVRSATRALMGRVGVCLGFHFPS